MCGIFGYVRDKPLNDDAVLNALRQRGPDGNGKVTFPIRSGDSCPSCTLLHTRLSIIDPSPRANQPMLDSTGRFAVVYNGMIYNYRDLRLELERLGHCFATQSDTEVLLNGYIEWKEQVQNRLRGMFAFCVFDRIEHRLFLARDHFGQKPLYYYHQGDTFCFSSSLSAIFASGLQNRFTLSKEAIREYLAFGSFISPRTILSEVKSLPPAHCLTCSPAGLRISKYYDLKQEISDSPDSREETARKLRDIMFDCVERHMIADVPLGIFLSGGIDSSIIAGIASKISNHRIQTFSVGFKGKHANHDETRVANKTGIFLNSIHENIYLDHNDFNESLEEFLDAIDMPSVDGLNTYFLTKAIGARVKVVLSGLGGDEMFAGYPVFHQIHNLQQTKSIDTFLSRLPSKILNRIGKSHLKDLGRSPLRILFDKRLIGKIEMEKISFLADLLPPGATPLKSVSLFEISNYMANMLLRDLDAVTMHHALECRAPFVDKKVFSFVMSVPDRYKVEKAMNKPLLVNTFSDLLVEDTYRLPKRGFTLPIQNWIEEYLSGTRVKGLHEISIDYDIYPAECPFKNESKLNTKRKTDFYKWMVLLMWISDHQGQLNDQVR